MKNYKKIGILGGMGPEATAELYKKIIKIFQNVFGAVYDDDFPEITIINLPLPDVVEKESKKVEKVLIYGVKKLETAGADFIAIPCNTVTSYIEVLKQKVSIPIINIIEETVKEVKRSNQKSIGLLSTEATIKNKLYSSFFPNIITLDEENQKTTTRVIMDALAGNKNNKQVVLKQISNLKEKGAKKVILGCTELPLIYTGKDVFDTIEILAKAIVRESTNSKII